MKLLSLCTWLLAVTIIPNLSAEDHFIPLEDGDRVVFLGDSITAQGTGPNGYVTMFEKQLQNLLPKQKITVIGAGIGGHKVPNLQSRLDKDVLEKSPTVVIIYIGINDVWHSIRNQGTSTDKFESGLKDLIARIEARNARVILATPSVIGEKFAGENPLDGMLAQYAGISRKVAYESGVQLLDLHHAFHQELESLNTKNLEKGILTTDGVHLNAIGNRFVAEQMLSAFGLTPLNNKKLLRHVVLVKFKEDLTENQVQEVVDAFAALRGKVESILDIEYGTNISMENQSAGFTHGFVITFADQKGFDDTLPHPAHLEFAKLARARVDDMLMFDYFAKQGTSDIE